MIANADGYEIMALGQREINVRQYLGWFNFKVPALLLCPPILISSQGADQQKKVANLSGGERNRQSSQSCPPLPHLQSGCSLR
eukprot:755029-Hanusia_phi.AAC.18